MWSGELRQPAVVAQPSCSPQDRLAAARLWGQWASCPLKKYSAATQGELREPVVVVSAGAPPSIARYHAVNIYEMA